MQILTNPISALNVG